MTSDNTIDYPVSWSDVPTPDLITAIRTCGLDVPDGLPETIISRGEEAVPLLSDLALDAALITSKDDAECWAPIHASFLLGEIGGPHAAQSLADLIRLDQQDNALDDWLHTSVSYALGACGPVALGPTKALIEDLTLDDWHRGAAVEAIQLIAYQHPDVREETARFLTNCLNKERDPGVGAD